MNLKTLSTIHIIHRTRQNLNFQGWCGLGVWLCTVWGEPSESERCQKSYLGVASLVSVTQPVHDRHRYEMSLLELSAKLHREFQNSYWLLQINGKSSDKNNSKLSLNYCDTRTLLDFRCYTSLTVFSWMKYINCVKSGNVWWHETVRFLPQHLMFQYLPLLLSVSPQPLALWWPFLITKDLRTLSLGLCQSSHRGTGSDNRVAPQLWPPCPEPGQTLRVNKVWTVRWWRYDHVMLLTLISAYSVNN